VKRLHNKNKVALITPQELLSIVRKVGEKRENIGLLLHHALMEDINFAFMDAFLALLTQERISCYFLSDFI